MKTTHITLRAFICAASLLFSAAGSLPAADLYVSAVGSDSNSGASLTQPLLTLQKADTLVKPGDTVWILDGVYKNAKSDKGGGGSSVLTARTSGTPTAPITWRSYSGQHPELIAQGCWNAIDIQGSYLIFDGLTLTGNNDNVRQADAEDNAEVDVIATNASKAKLDETTSPTMKKTADTAPARPKPVGLQAPSPLYNGNGISVNNRQNTANFVHHTTIRNCTVRKFGGAGISMLFTDYFTVENCEVYDNVWYCRYGASGISQLGGRNFDDAPGYHNIIRGNRVWRNKSLVRCTSVDRYTDGNGIILDSLDDGAFSGAVLVENNLVYDNGGGGIHVFKSNRSQIDVINNTVWRNQQVWRLYDLGAHSSKNVRFINNIVVGDKWMLITGDMKSSGITYDYNVYYGGLPMDTKGPHDVFADPLFVRPSTNYKAADFHVQTGSPALQSGVKESFSPMLDQDGKVRPTATPPDRGAYQR